MDKQINRPPRHRANHQLMEKRTGMVLALMAIGCSDSEIIETLIQKEGIHRKTARRYLQKAHQKQREQGNTPISENIGAIDLSLKHLRKKALSQPDPDLNLANNIIGNEIKLLKYKPNHTKGDHDDNSLPTGQSISPELEAVIQDFADAAKIEEPEGDG